MNGTANENGTLNLVAPIGKIFTNVIFASYGLPENYVINAQCHAVNSIQKVSEIFLGQNNAVIEATNAIFGDPCGGIVKRLQVVLEYGDASPSTAPTPQVTPQPEPTPEPSPTPTPEPTASPSPTPSEPTSTPSPTPQPTAEPTASPSPSPQPSPTPIPQPEPTPQPEPSTPEPTPLPSPTPIPSQSPEPIQSPEPTPAPSPSDSPSAEPTPEPTPEPEPSPEPTPIPSPEPEPSPSPEESPSPDPEPTPTPEPSEEPEPLPSESPTETDPINQTPEPQPSDESPSEIIDDILQDGTVTKEEITSLVDSAKADGKLDDEEREIIATAIVAQFADAEAVPASALIEAGLDFADLPAETPVDVRTDEDGNPVIISAEVADALELLVSPTEILTAIFESPAQLIFALGNLGADMSPEEREEATKTIIAATIVGNIATTTMASVAIGGAGYRRP